MNLNQITSSKTGTSDHDVKNLTHVGPKFAPLKKPLRKGQSYYLVVPAYYLDPNQPLSGYCPYEWCDDDYTLHRFRNNLCFASKLHVQRATIFIGDFVRQNQEILDYVVDEPKHKEEVWMAHFETRRNYPTKYDNSIQYHRTDLANGFIYKTERALERAIRIIGKAIKAESKRREFKFLIKAPEVGTRIYYPDNGSDLGWCSDLYDPNDPKHKNLLDLGFLFVTEKDVKRAVNATRRRINPLAPKV